MILKKKFEEKPVFKILFKKKEISAIFIKPVQPYIRLMPKSKKPVLTALFIYNLNPASSADLRSSFKKPIETHTTISNKVKDSINIIKYNKLPHVIIFKFKYVAIFNNNNISELISQINLFLIFNIAWLYKYKP